MLAIGPVWHVPFPLQPLDKSVHVSNQMSACPWSGSQGLGQPAIAFHALNRADTRPQSAGNVGPSHCVEVVELRLCL